MYVYVWHDNIAKGDHECVEGVMESDCAHADSRPNAFIAESNLHCDTDIYISDSYMRIADSSSSSSSNSSSSSSSSSSGSMCIADSNVLRRY
jgi:cellulase/cellobiase CelA1